MFVLRQIIKLIAVVVTSTLFWMLTSRKVNAQEVHTVNIGITQDTHAKEQFWYGSPFRFRHIYLGWNPYDKHKRTRPHIDYNLDVLRNMGISVDQIDSAYLKLMNWRAFSSSPFDVIVYPLVEEWRDVDVSWSNQPSVGTPALGRVLDGTGGWEKIDITDIVTRQFVGTLPEYGISIQKVLEFEQGAWFCSIDVLTVPNTTNDECSEDTLPHIEVSLTGWEDEVEIIEEDVIDTPVIKSYGFSPETGVYLEWGVVDGASSYQVEYSLYEDFTAAILFEISEQKVDIQGLSEGDVYLRVRAVRKGYELLDAGNISTWSDPVMVTVYYPDEVIKEEVEVEEMMEKVVEARDVTEVARDIPNEVPVISQGILTDDKNVVTSKAVLGVSDLFNIPEEDGFHHCEFKYNSHKQEVETVWCELPSPGIRSIKQSYAGKDLSWLNLSVAHESYLNILINVVDCKDKTLWDPRTWFICVEQHVENMSLRQKVNHTFMGRIDNKVISEYIKGETGEDIHSVTFALGKDYTDKDIQIFSQITFSTELEGGFWLDFSSGSGLSKEASIPAMPTSGIGSSDMVWDRCEEEGCHEFGDDVKPFRFPLDHYVGVTQWHGNTAFQSPHTGIDFSVVKKRLYALADGVVESALWDNYNGKCNSGGYSMRIKYDNGMHSVYMHMDNFIGNDGKELKVGDRVKSGDVVGMTGNTGRHNCQPLGYHLHFEVRRSRSQSTHMDPVPVVNADWNAIPTVGYDRFPGRLSGDNPHPGR